MYIANTTPIPLPGLTFLYEQCFPPPPILSSSMSPSRPSIFKGDAQSNIEASAQPPSHPPNLQGSGVNLVRRPPPPSRRRGARGGGIDWGRDTHKYKTKPQHTRRRFGHQSGLDESSDKIRPPPAWNCVSRLFGVFRNKQNYKI